MITKEVLLKAIAQRMESTTNTARIEELNKLAKTRKLTALEQDEAVRLNTKTNLRGYVPQ